MNGSQRDCLAQIIIVTVNNLCEHAGIFSVGVVLPLPVRRKSR